LKSENRVSGMFGRGRQSAIAVASWLVIVLPAPAQRVTFSKDIAPIIYGNCAPCHRPGQSGPFPLLTYEDVKGHAAQIADVTKRRYMPPFLPDPRYGDFKEERRLTEAQIGLIQQWVKAGSPEGSRADAPPVPKFPSEWPLGTPDLVLRVPQRYQLRADGPEVFWNFIIPVPITRARWVKAVDIHPSNPKVIHHASIILDRARSARRQSPGANGFAGMDLNITENSFDPDGVFLAWKPGSVPTVSPEGMAWRLAPGMDLILNAHLRPTGKAETVDAAIGLYFTDQPQTEFPLLIELEHDGAIDIPPGDNDYIITDEFRTPLDINVLAVYPHAHYLGKLLEGYATLPDGSRKWLIRIPNWDFSWQGVFHLRQPILLPRGTVISMRFHYDNSTANARNPNSPPKRVKGGSKADDEMGNLWLQVLPTEAGDKRAVLQEAVMHRLLEKYPGDFSANFNLGDLLLNKGNAAGAVPFFKAASRAKPASALAAAELGVALASASRMDDAKAQFRRALQLDPKFTDARYDLGSAEASAREWQAAASDFRQVLAERADDSKAKQHLGEVLFTWGDELANSGEHGAAVERYKEALQYRPGDAELHTNLGIELAQVGRLNEARAQLETAARLNPSFQPTQAALAAVRSRLSNGQK
jgi:tetratricopeptide (TPR) repeat protein/mono/diheme cytochrome c family protein